jgi:hypothetical protein
VRLRKVVNRVYEGTTYYRWVLSVPPKNVRDLGWVDGQELATVVRGSTLWIEPAVRPRASPRRNLAEDLESEVQRRSVARR